MSKPNKPSMKHDYRALRRKLNLSQGEFWGRIGVTQSGGSRFEAGRAMPKPTAGLAYMVYVQGVDFDVREFKVGAWKVANESRANEPAATLLHPMGSMGESVE